MSNSEKIKKVLEKKRKMKTKTISFVRLLATIANK
jgi:hypothetical protein